MDFLWHPVFWVLEVYFALEPWLGVLVLLNLGLTGFTLYQLRRRP